MMPSFETNDEGWPFYHAPCEFYHYNESSLLIL